MSALTAGETAGGSGVATVMRGELAHPVAATKASASVAPRESLGMAVDLVV